MKTIRTAPACVGGVTLVALCACMAQAQTQVIKLNPSDPGVNDRFGYSASIDAGTVVVGAYFDDDACPGDPLCDSGSAYVFEPSGASWAQVQKLTAPDAGAGDRFGESVAISGDVLVVGAWEDDDACVADPACASGSAYVFRRVSGVWTFEQKLTASDAAAGDRFGRAVAVSGPRIVVGASHDDDACVADPLCQSGAAYVFEFDGAAWAETAKLVAGDAALGDRLGRQLAIDGDTVVVGSYQDDFDCPLLLPDCDKGSAYVFRFDGASWGQEARLEAPDAADDDRFGRGVAIDGDVAIVGSYLDDDACPTDPLCNSGSAYVFRRSGSAWAFEQKLVPSDSAIDDRFSFKEGLAVRGDTILVGAHRSDVIGDDAGQAYLYEFDGAAWSETAIISGDDTATGDRFGYAIALDTDLTAVISAYRTNDGCPGVPGCDSGSVYLFEVGSPDAGCNAADLVEPFGTLDFSDVIAFLVGFGAMDASADLAPPIGVWDFSDVIAFLSAFGAGCP